MAKIPDEPHTDLEQYLNRIATGQGEYPPEPHTNVEEYLDYIVKNGAGGDKYATKEELEELDKKVDALASDLSYKGTVASYADLPANPNTADTYLTEDTGILYVWSGEEWIALNESYSPVWILPTKVVNNQRVVDCTYDEFEENFNSGKMIICFGASGYNGYSSNNNGTGILARNGATTLPNNDTNYGVFFFSYQMDYYSAGHITSSRLGLNTVDRTFVNGGSFGWGNFLETSEPTREDTARPLSAGAFYKTIGVRSDLQTTDKTKLVGAINEVNGKIENRVQTGNSAPISSTVGIVGQLYEDTTNGKLYQCTAIDNTDPQNPSYTWTEVGAGGGGTLYTDIGVNTDGAMTQKAVSEQIYGYNTTGTTLSKHRIVVGNPSLRWQNAYNVCVGNWEHPSFSSSFSDQYSVFIGGGKPSTTIGTGQTRALGRVVLGGQQGSTNPQNYANFSVNLGNGTQCDEIYGVSLGAGAHATRIGEINVSTGTHSTSGYNSSNYRLISGVYDGEDAHDAATFGQLQNAIINGGTTAPTTATVGAVGTLYSYVDTTGNNPEPHLMVCTAVTPGVDPDPTTYTWTDILAGVATALHAINNGGES